MKKHQKTHFFHLFTCMHLVFSFTESTGVSSHIVWKEILRKIIEIQCQNIDKRL